WMPGTGVAQQPTSRFVNRAKNRHEHVPRIVNCKGVIDSLKNLLRFLELRPQSADERHRNGHKERSGDALAGDISDQKNELAIDGAEDLEKIPSHFPGGFQ